MRCRIIGPIPADHWAARANALLTNARAVASRQRQRERGDAVVDVLEEMARDADALERRFGDLAKKYPARYDGVVKVNSATRRSCRRSWENADALRFEVTGAHRVRIVDAAAKQKRMW
jgi:hypothetical protein